MSRRELLAAAFALAAVQLAAALRFAFALLRRAARPRSPAAAPSAAVLVACKGDLEGLEDNIGSLLDQDYPGELQYVFVVPSLEDPARARLESALRGFSARRWRLLSSEARPSECSEQNVNLLHGLARLGAEAEVLLFADCDLRVPRRWACELVAALEEPGVGASTATVLYAARDRGLAALVRMLWIAAGVPYFDALGYVSGQSFAIKRRLFERLDIGGVWRRSINMDLTTAACVRRAGLSVRFVGAAMPVWLESCDLGAVLRGFDKWMLHFRLYGPLVWILGALTTAAKLYIYARALWPRPYPRAALLLAAGDALYLWVVLAALRRGCPAFDAALGRRRSWADALAAPLLTLVHAANLLASARPGRLRWGGRTYVIRGPLSITLEP